MEERTRKVDVTKLSREEVDNLSLQIGEKLREILDKACDEANKVCKIYGMTAKMQFVLEQAQPKEKE